MKVAFLIILVFGLTVSLPVFACHHDTDGKTSESVGMSSDKPTTKDTISKENKEQVLKVSQKLVNKKVAVK